VNVDAVRERFSSLRSGFAFFDAPGGTQVPDEVGHAIANALREASGNLGAPYATGRAVEQILERAKQDASRFLGPTPDEISFGMNMTTLDFAISRAAGRDLEAGDEVLTTELDHDGGVAPWVELAADKGVTVRLVRATDELTVDYEDLERKLSERTRVVAFALASNAVGSLADAHRICALARGAGAISWIDAVHYAAHEPVDVRELGCDVLLCSPYKFCGPHLGIAYVRRELAETWRPYKARPSASSPVGRRFETGTLPYELLAGFTATIAYLDTIGGMTAASTEAEVDRLLEELAALRY
jgi:cysteine desulfurase family protein (TIGR01976 family)